MGAGTRPTKVNERQTSIQISLRRGPGTHRPAPFMPLSTARIGTPFTTGSSMRSELRPGRGESRISWTCSLGVRSSTNERAAVGRGQNSLPRRIRGLNSAGRGFERTALPRFLSSGSSSDRWLIQEKGFLFSCTAFCGCEVQDGLHLDVVHCGSSAQVTEIRPASALFPKITENLVIPTGFGASRITVGTNSAR